MFLLHLDPFYLIGCCHGAPFPQICRAHCAGSAYFGVENGLECWCSGTYLTDYAYDVYVVSNGCTKPCFGNAGQKCGGRWAMNVYKNV